MTSKFIKTLFEEFILESPVYTSLSKSITDVAKDVKDLSLAFSNLAAVAQTQASLLLKHEKLIQQLSTIVVDTSKRETGMSLEMPDPNKQNKGEPGKSN